MRNLRPLAKTAAMTPQTFQQKRLHESDEEQVKMLEDAPWTLSVWKSASISV
jgi:hypothetical protein